MTTRGARARGLAKSLLVALALVLAVRAPASCQELPGADALPQDDPATVVYRAALELEAEGEHELADALFDYILRQYPDSAAAAAIREAWSAEGSRRIDSSGRTELVVWSTLYGLWLGVAVPGMFGADNPEPYGVGLLIGGPLGFFSSANATRDGPIGDGAAEAITWGGTWGTWQAFGWAHVLDIGGSCSSEFGYESCSGPTSEAVFASMVGGGLAGLAAGWALGRSQTVSPGRSTMASLGSLWGTWYGHSATVLLGMDADDDGDAILAATLIGGNLGLLAGATMRRGAPLSRSRARLASVAGVAGALAGVGLDLLFQPDEQKVAIAIPVATSLVGLALGLSNTDDPTEPEVDSVGPATGVSWIVGGPVLPSVVKGPDGRRGPALSVTLLSARF